MRMRIGASACSAAEGGRRWPYSGHGVVHPGFILPIGSVLQAHRSQHTAHRDYTRQTGTQAHGTQAHRHTGTGYTGTQAHRHTSTQAHKHTGTQAHKHTSTQAHGTGSTGTQAHRHTGTQAHRHTDTLYMAQGTRYTSIQAHRHTSTPNLIAHKPHTRHTPFATHSARCKAHKVVIVHIAESGSSNLL